MPRDVKSERLVYTYLCLLQLLDAIFRYVPVKTSQNTRHEIGPYLVNTAAPLTRPNFHGPAADRILINKVSL